MSKDKVCILDYGVGNLQSIRNAVKTSTEKDLDLVSEPENLKDYDKIILPGVGAFGDAMSVLRSRSLDAAVVEAYQVGKPLLGICLGMQLLATTGFEHGEHKGLGIIPGRVEKLRGSGIASIHMGWNDVEIIKPDPLLAGIENRSDFYFVHGYSYRLENPDHGLGLCEYGETFPVIVRNQNAWGCQFHPEKSQQQGINILKNFVMMSNA